VGFCGLVLWWQKKDRATKAQKRNYTKRESGLRDHGKGAEKVVKFDYLRKDYTFGVLKNYNRKGKKEMLPQIHRLRKHLRCIEES
jgi:hypothetical protein